MAGSVYQNRQDIITRLKAATLVLSVPTDQIYDSRSRVFEEGKLPALNVVSMGHVDSARGIGYPSMERTEEILIQGAVVAATEAEMARLADQLHANVMATLFNDHEWTERYEAFPGVKTEITPAGDGNKYRGDFESVLSIQYTTDYAPVIADDFDTVANEVLPAFPAEDPSIEQIIEVNP